MTQGQHAQQPHPSPQAQGQADARANSARHCGKVSDLRAGLEHVFADQKNRYGQFIRTFGIARAQAKLTLANLAYNSDRLIFREQCAATG